eukprot:s32_g6.t1
MNGPQQSGYKLVPDRDAEAELWKGSPDDLGAEIHRSRDGIMLLRTVELLDFSDALALPQIAPLDGAWNTPLWHATV